MRSLPYIRNGLKNNKYLSLPMNVPGDVLKPEYYYRYLGPGITLGEVDIKTQDAVNQMRYSCKIAAQMLKACGGLVKAGATTNQIDAFVHDQVICAGGYPSPLRYAGFPKSVCTSVNNVACHGIPNDDPLLSGDIVNVDVTVYFNGFYGDCSKTFLVGDVDDSTLFLVQSTQECLAHCINLCGPGVPFNAIGKYITNFCKARKLSVIPAFTGHGIGKHFHEPPEILHYSNSECGKMQQGMTFTIEPILSLGKPFVEVLEDGWTAITVDGRRCAQFEHTILITSYGSEVLTNMDKHILVQNLPFNHLN